MKKTYTSAHMRVITIDNDVIATSNFGVSSPLGIGGYSGKSFNSHNGDTFEDDEEGPISLIW